jgi:hypothetical protein
MKRYGKSSNGGRHFQIDWEVPVIKLKINLKIYIIQYIRIFLKMKTCSKCNIEQEDSSFPKSKNYCKKCGNEMCREYKKRNKEKISEYNKKYKLDHKEEVKEYNHNYNKDNREKIQLRQNIQHKERRKVDPNYKLRTNLGKRLYKAIKSKTNKTNDLLGTDIDTIKKWIEYNFYGDMTWENYGSLWHVDHVIPCSMFDLKKDENQIICFNWTNLRPLYAIDNLVKNNILFWSDLHNHFLKLNYFSKQNNINISLYSFFIKKLKYTKSSLTRIRWRLGNQDGIVKNI